MREIPNIDIEIAPMVRIENDVPYISIWVEGGPVLHFPLTTLALRSMWEDAGSVLQSLNVTESASEMLIDVRS